jgi:fructose-bisphosphate aldolase class II
MALAGLFPKRVNVNDVLLHAMPGNYAVAGLVVLGCKDAKTCVEAAAEVKLPVILRAGPGCRKHTPVAIRRKMFRYLAEQATMPIACQSAMQAMWGLACNDR